MSKQAQRALRIGRIARIGDAVAKASEAFVAQRRSDLNAQQERLSVVENYCRDYARLTEDREMAGQSVTVWRNYREFSGWLSQMSVAQRNEVAQAQFLLDAAADEALQKRNFAKALGKAADRAESAARREAERAEQQALDALVRPRPEGLAL
jgi:flagellar export protein FliJ